MNAINTIKFDFLMQNEMFARKLYARWDSFFTANVEHIADEVLARYDNPPETLEISRLDLDLGLMTEDDFDEQFAVRFRQQLEETFMQCLYNPLPGQQAKITPDSLFAFDILKQFLLHGTIAWHAAAEYRDIRRLFLKVLQESPQQLKQFLQTYGHYTSLQERLVYQMENAELEKGVHLLESVNATFICSYVKLLRKKYKTLEKPAIRENDYRHTVWFVVYAYLLNNHGSFFDKKTFVAQTLVQLAAKYNLNYNELLRLITQELRVFSAQLSMPPELFTILLELQKELDEQQFKSTFSDAAKFYKTIFALLKKDTKNPVLPGNSRKALIEILSRVDSCRLFLQQMNEPEIINLVPMIVAPTESGIVIKTAKSLDKQKEQGALQGKAGGEFRLLKWQIIFPVLFENRGAGFNRKYFVQSVLQKIAAHYNLDIQLLISYFLDNPQTKPWLDKELLQIFLSIRETLRKTRKTLSLPTEQSTEKYQFIQQLFPAESEFTVAYIQSLDTLSENTQRLQGKAGGEFHEIKWRFVFTVLSEIGGKSFNRRYFVSNVLTGIAAHYNLTCFDLLLYFHQEEINRQLPFHLHTILRELYEAECEHWTNIALQNGSEADKFKLIATLSPKGKKFIKTYIRALDAYHAKGVLQGKASGNFRQIKWKFIFEILVEMQQMTFNKKHFVARTLQQMAAHYNLSFCELLSYFAAEPDIFANSEFAEASRIIYELRNSQLPPAFIHIPAIQHDQPTWSGQSSNFTNNAGMVLLSPYLPRLFSMLELTEDGKFKDREAQIRAIFLLQYAVFGTIEEYPEHVLTLNKLLTGFQTGKPIPRTVELTETETAAVDSLLQGVLANWEKLKNTSVAGLRESFLQREGKLEEREDIFHLTMEEKAYDILLDSCPWSFKTIKFGWMKKGIEVKWR
ncbi:MAG: hypothetical protein LBR97_05810 [Dysgonamonadaceae bacterium]|jgi:hypothetical protein|nr:hypothetical protein [Dysgonamonadaceae bacterium]